MTEVFTRKKSSWLIIGFGILVSALIFGPWISKSGGRMVVIYSDKAICEYAAAHPEAYRLDRTKIRGWHTCFATIKSNRDRIRPVPRIANEPPSSADGFRVATVTDDSTLTVLDRVGTAFEGQSRQEYTFHPNGDIDIRSTSDAGNGRRESIASVHGKTGLIICELSGTKANDNPDEPIAHPVGFMISEDERFHVSQTGFNDRDIMGPFNDCDTLLRQITEKMR